MKPKKKITHIHVRIKKLADAAIARGDIISCTRQSDDSYIIDRTGCLPTTFTYVGVGLFLLNSLVEETNTETIL
ncbi:MAG: hypothetical protein QQW96_03780 [Tychonema bourrellyi B0820]|nr:hypothetical protein [Tychonema bourrellyi B0820]PJE45238.1 MAG: hypothetical protein CUR32_01160 [Flavobacterium sp.] [Flavobacterium sp. FEMGT703F]